MPIPKELHRPLTVIQAPYVLDVVAKRMGITVRALRCIALLVQVDCDTYKVTIQALADLLGYHYNTCLAGVKEGIAAELIKTLRKRNGGLSITLAAHDVLSRIKRQESETRSITIKHGLPKRPRAYNRKPADVLV
jgi:hypothetical protein